jgi:hypothetical protein
MECLLGQMLDGIVVVSLAEEMAVLLAAIKVAMKVELKGLIEAVMSDNVMAASKV